MKKSLLFAFFISFCYTFSGQIEVDKPIQLTGIDSQRSITNLEAPVNGTDAVNKNYVDNAVAALGGGSEPTMISDESASTMNFGEAISYCKNLSYEGHSDWYIGTQEQFVKVLSTGGTTVANDASANYFWTSSTPSYNSSYTRSLLRLSDGYYAQTSATNTQKTRCIR
ncbi:MAG: hypothetical protein IT223_04980 [Crocinitomicaceae bacterium]|nr:hypothetical protein [Crocinitomicaceae bacterium]